MWTDEIAPAASVNVDEVPEIAVPLAFVNETVPEQDAAVPLVAFVA